MKKRILMLLLALTVLVGAFTLTASAAEIIASGTCGENLTWTLDSKGTLTISGSGDMENYTEKDAPWHSLRDTIVSALVADGVTSIGNYAFYFCDSLTGITLPENLASIGEAAFYFCDKLNTITIPDSVTGIDNNAFCFCASLNSITLPKNLTSISWRMLSGCENLSSITLPESVTSIDGYAFSGCRSLSSITLPENLTSIGEAAFACTNLTSITIPESITSISDYVFNECTSLSSITIPDSVTSIGESAFYYCTSLSTVHYAGTEAQRADILICRTNAYLTDATWHYECDGVACMTPETPPTNPEDTNPAENPFADITTDAYYFTPVLWAVEKGVTTGVSETSFAPDSTCTRAQIVTFLWRANGSPAPTSDNNPFTDVPAGQWYTDAVLWAVEKGITSGTSATSFSPDTGCTRGQVATFLWRAEGEPATNGSNIFADIAPGAYYYDAVLWAVENGITNGMGDGTFAPDATCTRGQIVTFLYRAMV